MKLIKANQRGFTLIEILVAIVVGGMVVAAASTVVMQILQSSRSSSQMTALRQVQTAGYWVSHDALQAQEMNTNDFLYIKWTDWDDGDIHEIEYSLVGSGTLKHLQRQEIINDDADHPTITIVARYVDSSQTSCTPANHVFVPGELLTFMVTATMEEQTETRTYKIKPRAL
ncbi:MAG: prepilin-type N-terminal cleavage/methylation domain-containing protein [Chloroflexota bacterium]|nr:prepilin-type N-terminal cleavage/methylation domain-containing protein [Chloroflexota bacterium]